MQKIVNVPKKAVQLYGKERAKVLNRRLDDLRAAANLESMRMLPGKCHELVGDYAGQFSVALDGPYRLIFEPNHVAKCLDAQGTIVWDKVTSITVIRIENYHD